jgi:hypothetical protein
MLEGLRPDNTKPIAAIVSLPQTNIEISGDMCSGIFSEKDYADYSGSDLTIPLEGRTLRDTSLL